MQKHCMFAEPGIRMRKGRADCPAPVIADQRLDKRLRFRTRVEQGLSYPVRSVFGAYPIDEIAIFLVVASFAQEYADRVVETF